jgi:hypothetical protein
VDDQWVSQSSAARYLGVVAPTQAHRALTCGLAGPAKVEGSRRLYRLSQVEELGSRPAVGADELDALGALGAMLLRVPVTVPSAAIADLDALLVGPWRSSLPVQLLIAAAVARSPFPLIATVSGFIVGGRDIVGIDTSLDGIAFRLAAAGEWRRAVHRRRWPLRGGGPPLRYVHFATGGPRYFV